MLSVRPGVEAPPVPRRGQIETNLLRSATFHPCGHAAPSPDPFTARTLLGMDSMVASRQLSISDMAVLAAICQHLPKEGDPLARTSLYELAQDVYGQVGGKQADLIFESLRRLAEITLRMPGFDATSKTMVRSVSGVSMANLVGAIWVDSRDLQVLTKGELGALNHRRPVRVEISAWLARQLRAGHATWLDLELLRALGPGLAGRLWAFIEGERLPGQDLMGNRTGALGLGAPAIATLGLAKYQRRADVNRKLREAAERIVRLDPAWASVELAGRAGSWQLRYARRDLPPAKLAELRRGEAWRRADERSERREVRAVIRESLRSATDPPHPSE